MTSPSMEDVAEKGEAHSAGGYGIPVTFQVNARTTICVHTSPQHDVSC